MNDVNVLYSGNVDVHLHIGSKVIKLTNKHNSGTSYLTQVFAKYICGDHDNIETNKAIDIPEYIDLEYRVSSTVEGETVWSDWSSFLREPIELNSKTYDYSMTTDTSGNAFAQYVAHLSGTLSSYLMQEQVTEDMASSYQFRFTLKSGEDESYTGTYHDMAYLGTDVDTLLKITPGTQATIVWNMSLRNG